MSSARARANHSLYLARILIRAWVTAEAEQALPQSLLAQAYAPGCQSHLVNAYGWFLLAIGSPDNLPETPPASVDDLPPVPPGKALPGELREFSQLEEGGWLAELLAPLSPVTGAVRARDPRNLAAPAAAGPAPVSFSGWADELASLFDRMGDSLDEY